MLPILKPIHALIDLKGARVRVREVGLGLNSASADRWERGSRVRARVRVLQVGLEALGLDL